MFETREAWLLGAVDKIRELFESEGFTVPPLRVSVGWPGGRGKKATTIGQCWPPEASEDAIAEVFISPVLGKTQPGVVLATLVHEMVHAINHAEGHTGHRKEFSVIAKQMGLTGKMTATVAGEELQGRLAVVAEALGDFPHGAMVTGARAADSPKKQETRMIKIVCPDCGYTARTTRKWLDVGTPSCPSGDTMEEAV